MFFERAIILCVSTLTFHIKNAAEVSLTKNWIVCRKFNEIKSQYGQYLGLGDRLFDGTSFTPNALD